MPHFKQLAEGEQPANLEKFILIEVIREPAIGYQQSDRKRLGSGLPTVRRFHGLHAGKRARTRSGIGQGCVLANHLPEQWHRPNGDVIPMRLGSVHDPLLGTELEPDRDERPREGRGVPNRAERPHEVAICSNNLNSLMPFDFSRGSTEASHAIPLLLQPH
jgi:hypothetical protein